MVTVFSILYFRSNENGKQAVGVLGCTGDDVNLLHAGSLTFMDPTKRQAFERDMSNLADQLSSLQSNGVQPYEIIQLLQQEVIGQMVLGPVVQLELGVTLQDVFADFMHCIRILSNFDCLQVETSTPRGRERVTLIEMDEERRFVNRLDGYTTSIAEDALKWHFTQHVGSVSLPNVYPF